MTRRSLALFLTLAAAVAAPACGKSGPKPGPTSQAVEGDISSLVPSDAVGLLHVASLDGLAAKVKTLVSAVDRDAAAGIDLDKLLAGMDDMPPVIVRQLDRSRPLAFAVSFAGDQPVLTVIAPMKDAALVVKELGAANVGSAGRYVSLSQGPAPAARGGAEIAKTVPRGDLSIRMDLAKLGSRFLPQIDQMMGSAASRAEGPGAAQMSQLTGQIRGFVESAEWLDLAFRLDGARVNVDGEFRAKAGSDLAKSRPVSGDLAALGQRLPKEFPVAVLLSFDPAGLQAFQEKSLEASFGQMAPEQREAMTRLLGQMREASVLLGEQHAIGMGAGTDGLEVAFVSAAKDAKAFLAKAKDMYAQMSSLGGPAGAAFESLSPTTIDGVETIGMRMGLSGPGMESVAPLFGAEGMVFRMAAVDGRVVGVMGSSSLLSSAIASAKKGGKASPGLAEAVRLAGGKPSLVVRIDGRELARQGLALMRRMAPGDAAGLPDVPAGPSALFLAHATADGRTYRGGVTIDVGAWAEVVKPIVASLSRAGPPGFGSEVPLPERDPVPEGDPVPEDDAGGDDEPR